MSDPAELELKLLEAEAEEAAARARVRVQAPPARAWSGGMSGVRSPKRLDFKRFIYSIELVLFFRSGA